MSARFTFWTLIFVVAIAGACQGLTLPLLSILLDREGYSSVASGSSAAALYLGILLVSPFQELILRKFGYRTTILIGLTLVTATVVLFPVFRGYVVWLLLRLILGVGDSTFHYAAQMWITQSSAPERRGRNITMYGFAFGAGFSIGPVGMLLLPFGVWYPFLSLCFFLLLAFALLSRLPNIHPEPVQTQQKGPKENRYLAVIRLGWLALLPALIYGFLETTLNVSFPVYADHIGLPVKWVSILLPSFVIGGLLVQMPVGRYSDKVGRKKVLMGGAFLGSLAFFALPFATGSLWLMMLLLILAGATVGSFYSLGLAYAADLLPNSMIPTMGIIAGMNFSIACILAPNLNGVLMQYAWPGLMFVLMGAYLLVFALLGFVFRPSGAQVQRKEEEMVSC